MEGRENLCLHLISNIDAGIKTQRVLIICLFVRSRLLSVYYSDMSAIMIWNFFNDVMQQAIEDYVPNISSVINKKKPLWMTGEVLRMVKRKHQLWKKKMARKQR